MKRYAVVFEESAQADVRESYEWGWALPQKSEKTALIHTGLQPGDKQSTRLVNRFNGLLIFSRHSGDWLRRTCPVNDTEKPLKRFL